MNNTNNRPQRLDRSGICRSHSLDLVRITALLMVLLVHFCQHFPVWNKLRMISITGAAGVQIFFVLSAYLSCISILNKKFTLIQYYKTRALRILPMYYVAILICMVFYEFVIPYPISKSDTLYLGWLRYFFGLQNLLPSNCFFLWNNCMGLWCMTSFLLFYALVPFILKFVTNYKQSVIFLVFSLILAFMTHISELLISTDSFDNIKTFLKWHPISQMRYFAMGFLIFFSIKEAKHKTTYIIFTILALLFYFSPPMIVASLVGITMLILLSSRKQFSISNRFILKLVQNTSKYSWHMYLAHIIALFAGGHIADYMSGIPSAPDYYFTKLIAFIILTILLIFIYELSQRLVEKIFNNAALRKRKAT